MANSDEKLLNPRKFSRGLHLGPAHPVASQTVVDMPAPKKLYVGLRQHYGRYCQPKVSVGDQVAMGQLLGESADPMSAPVHAPVSGVVAAVGDHIDPFGRVVPTVTIENDGKDQWVEAPVEDAEFMKKRISAMMKAVRQAGIVEASSGRPVYSMLAPPERPKSYIFLVGIPLLKPVKLLIVNGLDSQPTLASNRRLLFERTRDVKLAVELVRKIVGVKDVVFAAEAEASGAAPTALHEMAGDRIQTLALKNRYPVAYPNFLTTAVTGKEVPSPDGDPRDMGVLVLEVESILGILDAVRGGQPQLDRVVTVVGSEMTPRNIRVRIGTPLADVLAFAGGSFDRAAKVILGGPMDGSAQFSAQTPITKQTNGLLVQTSAEATTFAEHLCIKCGRCVGVCPMRILPNVITNFCEFGFFAEAEDAELFKCVECGCCAYVCPARRPLVHYVKHGKAEVTAMRTAQ